MPPGDTLYLLALGLSALGLAVLAAQLALALACLVPGWGHVFGRLAPEVAEYPRLGLALLASVLAFIFLASASASLEPGRPLPSSQVSWVHHALAWAAPQLWAPAVFLLLARPQVWFSYVVGAGAAFVLLYVAHAVPLAEVSMADAQAWRAVGATALAAAAHALAMSAPLMAAGLLAWFFHAAARER